MFIFFDLGVSFSRIDEYVSCCPMVGVSICLSNTGVDIGLFKEVTGVSSNSKKHYQKQGQFAL